MLRTDEAGKQPDRALPELEDKRALWRAADRNLAIAQVLDQIEQRPFRSPEIARRLDDQNARHDGAMVNLLRRQESLAIEDQDAARAR